MKKKVLSVILAAVCTMGLMAGCGAEGSKGSTQSGAKGDSYTVGISQFAEHGSLDNCREGFLEGLKEEGIEEGKNLKVDYQNAQTDTGTASTIADSFVSEKVDMICAIATPCAASAYNSAMNADIPTVYTAVSDPVVAGLAKEDGSSVGNITGSSDVLPVEEQLKMIREMMPDAKKIGIMQAVDLSFLSEDAQQWVLVAIQETNVVITTQQSAMLKESDKKGELTFPMVRMMLEKEKTVERKVVIKTERINNYFPATYSREQIENIIYQLLENWKSTQ